jgi:hypothetical protein
VRGLSEKMITKGVGHVGIDGVLPINKTAFQGYGGDDDPFSFKTLSLNQEITTRARLDYQLKVFIHKMVACKLRLLI